MSTTDCRHERIDVRLKRAIQSRQMPRELLIVGPAGTGKTYPILAVLHCLARDYPLRILFLRATRVSLTESVLVTYEQEILPADGCESIASGAGRSHRHSYLYPNGSEIVVAGLDRHATRVLSTAWDIVFANEAIELQQDVWETVGTRLSRPGRDPRFGWLLGDTNPSHPDHWLKKRIDGGGINHWETTHEANPLLHDGRDWTSHGHLYLAALDRLTGPRRKRLRDGIWAQGEGIWFDTFDPDVHVSALAEFNPLLRTYCAIDSGVWTGAIWFQVRESPSIRVNVFHDYLSEGVSAGATRGRSAPSPTRIRACAFFATSPTRPAARAIRSDRPSSPNTNAPGSCRSTAGRCGPWPTRSNCSRRSWVATATRRCYSFTRAAPPSRTPSRPTVAHVAPGN